LAALLTQTILRSGETPFYPENSLVGDEKVLCTLISDPQACTNFQLHIDSYGIDNGKASTPVMSLITWWSLNIHLNRAPSVGVEYGSRLSGQGFLDDAK
jgi:hypothetical protein